MSNYDKFYKMLNGEARRRMDIIKVYQEEIEGLRNQIQKKEDDIETQRYFVSELIEAMNHLKTRNQS